MGAARRMLTDADREEISRGVAQGEQGKVIAPRRDNPADAVGSANDPEDGE